MPLLFIIATMAFYTALLIQKIMDADPSIRSYPDIGERAFGRKGRMLASSFMNLELYFVAIGFLILEGDNLHNIFPDGFQLNGLKIQGRESFIMIVALVILPTILLKNLSILSYVSATGVIACVIILGSIIWTGTFDGVGFHERGVAVNLNGIPIAASLYAFCYCGHPVFPTLYTSMRNRKNFTKVTKEYRSTQLASLIIQTISVHIFSFFSSKLGFPIAGDVLMLLSMYSHLFINGGLWISHVWRRCTVRDNSKPS